MATDAASFFELFFRELGKRGIPFAILHDYEQLPDQMSSDIDFVVHHVDLPRLLPIQREIARRQGWELVNVVEAKLSAQYAVFLDPKNPSCFLQLDACGHYFERDCFVLSDSQLLENHRPFKFFNIPSPSVEFAYLLSKTLLKGKSIEPRLPRLRELWKLDAAGTEILFKRLTGESDEIEKWFARPAADWGRLSSKIRTKTRFGLVNRCRELVRMAGRICRPVGLHVAIYGPDGVGKSTLISRLMLPCFRQTRQFHFRPGVFGKKARGAVEQPHAEAPRSRLSSIAKILYYFADHWIGYLSQVFPAKVRNELVIFDRSFKDVLVDPRRYRLSGGKWLAGFLSKLLPSPDLTFVLDAEPELVHARKPELAIDELSRQREVLRRWATATTRCSVISAAQTPDDVLRAAQREMIQFLAKREETRHSNSAA